MSSFELPKRRHLVHKPVEFRNLSKKVAAIRSSVTSKDWVWQRKYDGCHGIVVVQGGVARMFSREGNEVLSQDHILGEMRWFPDGAYFGEVWSPWLQFPQISGLFRKQQSSDETVGLRYVLFDYVPLDCWECGVDNMAYADRWNRLCRNFHRSVGEEEHSELRLADTFLYSEERLQQDEDRISAIRSFGHVYGLDGYVAKHIRGDWTAGDGKRGQQIKVKDHISVDLRCVGIVEGEGKFKGMVGALEVMWNGQRTTVSGGRLTNDERVKYFHQHSAFSPLVGKIIEVHALGLTPDGNLREPRFQRVREDKTEESV